MKLNYVGALGLVRKIRLDAVDKPRHVEIMRLILWGSLRDKPRQVGGELVAAKRQQALL